MSRRLLPGSRGFTLTEVMMAMAILVIGMMVTLPLTFTSVAQGARARRLTAAQALGNEVMERLRIEVRYDWSSTVTTLDSAWNFDVLPHAVGSAATAGDGCQPGGANDGVSYDYGPFRFTREGQDLLVCYALETLAAVDPRNNAREGIPTQSAEARVRVLWRSATGGWSSWSFSDILHAGSNL